MPGSLPNWSIKLETDFEISDIREGAPEWMSGGGSNLGFQTELGTTVRESKNFYTKILGRLEACPTNVWQAVRMLNEN